ncbi:MAG: SDR family oxidoreductase [Thermoflexales bacterium]|nr:SDR family oxidoreductase [Thermoflexales bacterium]MDW8351530.1 SDR family oxidoreductase [Anaerolineae bacterium]
MSDLQGKICVVTGATAGIGLVSAQRLAQMGATVVVVSRNPRKCDEVVEAIRRQTGNSAVEAMPADLSSLNQVRAVARRFLDTYPRLDVLLNNAGAIFTSRQVSAEGIEMTWALNHLSYFLLTHLLMDALKAAPSARVINVSSDAHRIGTIAFDDVQFSRRRYSGFGAYSQSKLANVMHAYALARRLEGTSVTVNALHPGAVATNFGKNNGGLWGRLFELFSRFTLSPEEGAQTSIYLASSPEVAGVTGQYFYRCRPKPSSPASYDVQAQERLWELSVEMAGL